MSKRVKTEKSKQILWFEVNESSSMVMLSTIYDEAYCEAIINHVRELNKKIDENEKNFDLNEYYQLREQLLYTYSMLTCSSKDLQEVYALSKIAYSLETIKGVLVEMEPQGEVTTFSGTIIKILNFSWTTCHALKEIFAQEVTLV